MIEVGVIGYGFVGKAVSQLAVKDKIKVIPFDLYQQEYAGPMQMLAAYNADIVFVCVPTPTDPEDGALNVDIVVDSASKWKEFSQKPDSVLVIKSTIPVGTIDELCEYEESDRIVHNPEFLTERTAMQDFMDADEIIVGGPNKECVNRVLDLYSVWVENTRKADNGTVLFPKMVETDAKTAELVKNVRNSFYATKVSFFNEVADLCESMDVKYDDFRKVFARSGKHAWVNPQHTFVPGPDGKKGYGGKCLIKDSLGLATLADTHGVDLTVLKAANKSNISRRPDEYRTDKSDDQV